MRYCRLIAPAWLKAEGATEVLEGTFTEDALLDYNTLGYNAYYTPNSCSNYTDKTILSGTNIDTWHWVFIDYDCKSNTYASKEAFIEEVLTFELPPTQIVDSGNGIHVYWRISDLTAKDYLRLSRRLIRRFNTDEAVCKIFQLMRLPGTFNTKDKTKFKICELLADNPDNKYTCEELSKHLPAITAADEEFCEQHYNRTYSIQDENFKIDDRLPQKFGKLLSENAEAKSIWGKVSNDRSKGDFRLGHLMFANDFNKEEAISVLVNSAKALTRAPIHRLNYAKSIVDTIWTYEKEPDKAASPLSNSVKDILSRAGDTLKGTPFRCHPCIDNTQYGFRLGQVIGLVAGSGVGKTAYALNMFRWFAERNPDYHHFFIPLEQPANEIADRWQIMSGADTSLHEKVHIMSNYDETGNFRHLSFDEIKNYIEEWQKTTGNKVGCVVIDHIGALKKKGAKDESQDLMTICHNMKAFAIQTNTLLIMQSQTSREKAGIGDLELNKDAAYGTVFFEAYCDFLITLWQPLKRCHKEPTCPTITAFKFCKIRNKKTRQDVIQEDVCYYLYFDSERELMRGLTQDEEAAFQYYLPQATTKRKADRKTDLVEYQSVPTGQKGEVNATSANSNRHSH